MINWIARAVRRPAVLLSAVLLGLVAAAALPAAPANASAAVESWWGNYSADQTLDCSLAPTYTDEPALPVSEVYNPCGYRVWVHYVSDSDPQAGQSYCVNPDGGLAYDIPNFPFDSGEVTYSYIQLTSNPDWCDAGTSSSITYYKNGSPLAHTTSLACSIGGGLTVPGVLAQVSDSCDSRMWLYGPDNAILCLSPGVSGGSFGTTYDKVLLVANQAPCGDTMPHQY
jgi:hypothetical protein